MIEPYHPIDYESKTKLLKQLLIKNSDAILISKIVHYRLNGCSFKLLFWEAKTKPGRNITIFIYGSGRIKSIMVPIEKSPLLSLVESHLFLGRIYDYSKEY